VWSVPELRDRPAQTNALMYKKFSSVVDVYRMKKKYRERLSPFPLLPGVQFPNPYINFLEFIFY